MSNLKVAQPAPASASAPAFHPDASRALSKGSTSRSALELPAVACHHGHHGHSSHTARPPPPPPAAAARSTPRSFFACFLCGAGRQPASEWRPPSTDGDADRPSPSLPLTPDSGSPLSSDAVCNLAIDAAAGGGQPALGVSRRAKSLQASTQLEGGGSWAIGQQPQQAEPFGLMARLALSMQRRRPAAGAAAGSPRGRGVALSSPQAFIGIELQPEEASERPPHPPRAPPPLSLPLPAALMRVVNKPPRPSLSLTSSQMSQRFQRHSTASGSSAESGSQVHLHTLSRFPSDVNAALGAAPPPAAPLTPPLQFRRVSSSASQQAQQDLGRGAGSVNGWGGGGGGGGGGGPPGLSFAKDARDSQDSGVASHNLRPAGHRARIGAVYRDSSSETLATPGSGAGGGGGGGSSWTRVLQRTFSLGFASAAPPAPALLTLDLMPVKARSRPLRSAKTSANLAASHAVGTASALELGHAASANAAEGGSYGQHRAHAVGGGGGGRSGWESGTSRAESGGMRPFISGTSRRESNTSKRSSACGNSEIGVRGDSSSAAAAPGAAAPLVSPRLSRPTFGWRPSAYAPQAREAAPDGAAYLIAGPVTALRSRVSLDVASSSGGASYSSGVGYDPSALSSGSLGGYSLLAFASNTGGRGNFLTATGGGGSGGLGEAAALQTRHTSPTLQPLSFTASSAWRASSSDGSTLMLRRPASYLIANNSPAGAGAAAGLGLGGQAGGLSLGGWSSAMPPRTSGAGSCRSGNSADGGLARCVEGSCEQFDISPSVALPRVRGGGSHRDT